jgi:shikimate kinase/3-dehydroquinate synthase
VVNDQDGANRVDDVERVVLIGFSGTGKSSVARHLADRLRWTAADSDEAIERQWGMTIPAIFRDHGEGAFRASERSALHDLLTGDHTVIATGGGAAVDPSIWDRELLGRRGTLVVALDASPETIFDRLRRQATVAGEAVERPMLASADPLERIGQLKQARQHAYDEAHLTLSSESATAEEIADELATLVRLTAGHPLDVRLEAASGLSTIHVGPGVAAAIGRRVRDEWPKARRAWIVSDTHVAALHAGTVERSLDDAGLQTATCAVEPGEPSKSLATAGKLYDWLLGEGVERGDVVIALGGGVVGDLAGFVAATVLRGIGLVQVPTTLLAAVDSSVGGKTGINHAVGKNLIGAFLQPRLVFADTGLLRTMPPRELRSGWAEVIKHAVIQRSMPAGERADLATVLERTFLQLRHLSEPATAYLVWRNIQLKAAVVAADERETGVRAFLNFGHTIGHGIEAADYQLLHGEAVAIGMRAAAELGVLLQSCGRDEAARIERLIDAYGLPGSAPINEERVLAKMRSDKKRIAGQWRFVLPLDGGGVELRDGVPEIAVAQALAMVNAARPAA